MQQDSIEGIYDTLKQCALISKNAGGVGLHVHCIRASGSFIAGVSLTCFVPDLVKSDIIACVSAMLLVKLVLCLAASVRVCVRVLSVQN